MFYVHSNNLELRRIKARLYAFRCKNLDWIGQTLADAQFARGVDYTIGRFFGKDGRAYLGTRPSRKAVKSLLRRIHASTTPRWHRDAPEDKVVWLNRLLRGSCGYFDQGPVMPTYDLIRRYVDRRLRHWLMRRIGKNGRGFKQFSQNYLHETLGLFRITERRIDLPRAKA